MAHDGLETNLGKCTRGVGWVKAGYLAGRLTAMRNMDTIPYCCLPVSVLQVGGRSWVLTLALLV